MWRIRKLTSNNKKKRLNHKLLDSKEVDTAIIILQRSQQAYVNGIFAIICRGKTIDLCITITIYVPLAELEQSKKQSEQDKKAIEELVRERDILNKNMLKAAGNTQKQLNLVKLHEQSKKNLEQEIQNYKEEAQKQRKIIYQLEKERDRYINEASDLTQKVGKRFSSPS